MLNNSKCHKALPHRYEWSYTRKMWSAILIKFIFLTLHKRFCTMLLIYSTQYWKGVHFANASTVGVHFAVCTKWHVPFPNYKISGSVRNTPNSANWRWTLECLEYQLINTKNTNTNLNVRLDWIWQKLELRNWQSSFTWWISIGEWRNFSQYDFGTYTLSLIHISEPTRPY